MTSTNPEHLETLDDISIQTLIDHYLSVREKLPDNLTVRDRLVELQQELLNRSRDEHSVSEVRECDESVANL